MSNSGSEKPRGFADVTKIGDYAAQQPVSGVEVVVTSTVNNGHGSFVHTSAQPEPKTEENSAA